MFEMIKERLGRKQKKIDHLVAHNLLLQNRVSELQRQVQALSNENNSLRSQLWKEANT